MITSKTIDKFRDLPTPFYYLRSRCSELHTARQSRKNPAKAGFKVHYAVKANANPRILKIISSYGFGADCVSRTMKLNGQYHAGFNPSEIVFAGVGKTDKDIEAALKADIFCFNCESIPEMEVINSIAENQNKVATDST